ncbi:MAG: anhydro-N-acetylmuramic acid kinase [Flavobacteriales bacterium]|nr:anhydro-N-acetylmuramic acid kinase [Flavobacteriales bacterium]
MPSTSYNVIGLMSGTSLDGVDLAFCTFTKDKKWHYEIVQSRTYPYTQKWEDILANSQELPERILREVDNELGKYYAQLIENFINEYQLIPDFVSSHGHTALHRPDKGISLQLGSGEIMAHELRLAVVNDFRKKDVALGGQGAPLVPIGDHLLFSKYDLCLNLGGFSNVSYLDNGVRKAFDICPVNMALNEAVKVTGKEYDEDGNLARSGDVHESLLKLLNGLEYYQLKGPKSLGREWYISEFNKRVEKRRLSPIDLLATLVEHISMQISRVINELEVKKVLVTGGGAYNSFLMERLSYHCSADISIPDNDLVDFKEALIFAFLGVLRMRNEINVLSSVTGAPKDHCAGIIHKP